MPEWNSETHSNSSTQYNKLSYTWLPDANVLALTGNGSFANQQQGNNGVGRGAGSSILFPGGVFNQPPIVEVVGLKKNERGLQFSS